MDEFLGDAKVAKERRKRERERSFISMHFFERLKARKE
jgi:hypothetical protein